MKRKTYPIRIPESLMKEVEAVRKKVLETSGLTISFVDACLIVAYKSRNFFPKNISVEQFKTIMEDHHN